MTKECSTLDMPISDPTFLAWSKVKSHLAIGTASGNVLLYKEFAEAPISIVSVLPTGITSGLWGCNDCFLAVSSVSTKTLAVLEENGEHNLHLQMKYPPVSLSFSSTSQRTGIPVSSAICINSGGKVLYVKEMERLCAPFELSFHHSRGVMVKCIWIDSMILVGFNSGELLLLSAFFSDQMQVNEVWSKTFNEVAPLSDIKFIPMNKKLLACGKENISFFEYFERSCVPISTHPLSCYQPHNVTMSEEGNMLSLATHDCKLVFYSIHSQLVTYAANGKYIAFISSPFCLMYGNAEPSTITASLPLPFEPSIVAIAPTYVAVGNASMVLVYSKDNQELIFRRENLKRVSHLNISSKYLVFFNDLKLHVLELAESHSSENEVGVVMSIAESEVTCLSMTEHFIIFGTSQGAVEFLSLSQRKPVDSLRYQHPCAIKYLAPSSNGARILLVDVSGKAMLFLPSAQVSLQLPEFPNKFDSIIWDMADTNVVNVIDDVNIHCYIYIHQSIRGTMISKLGQVHVDLDGGITIYPMPFQLRVVAKPIVCYNGEFTFLDDNRKRSVISPFYCSDSNGGEAYASFLTLLKFEDCWREALKLNERHIWLALASKALEVLDIGVAIRVYRFLHDAGMVLLLEKLSFVEDKNLLAGYILMIFTDYDSAQNSLLNSKKIDVAIDMRLNVLHFDEALSLASKSCQEKLIFHVSLKYGQYLEAIGKFERALSMYDAAFNLGNTSKVKPSYDTESCTGGLARSLIRSGNFERGFKVALQIDCIPIKIACAELLLSCNQVVEAAALFESCHEYDKAAELYLRVNHVTFLGKIVDKIISSMLLAKIGIVLEEAGRNRLAMEAYERAGEVDSYVRIYLRAGGHQKAAIEMVKNHKSIENAKILVEHCLQQTTVDYPSVIELLIMSAEYERAFSIAKENNLMDTFVQQSVIDSNIAIIVGKYYEENRILGKAGQFYSIGGQYDRAISLYLESGEDCITDAIQLTEVTKDISHVSKIIDYLSSERNSEAKDPLMILKVFSSLENFGEAIVYALSVAKRDEENGEYSNAHIVIASLISTMERRNTHIPQVLRSKFVLYHSYKLIKFHEMRGSHKNSASLLLRVVENLDVFPHHKYELLISTVIECLQAGFLVSLIP